MGIRSSREPRRPSPAAGKHPKHGYFRRRKPSLTTLPILPTVTQPLTHQPLYATNYPFGRGPVYGRVQPMPSSYSPIVYNNYPVSPYMMMAAPYTPPPYLQPPQIQPAYNNIGYPGGSPYYPSPYPPAPARLLTDWTGGGKISPGFLGPPL